MTRVQVVLDEARDADIIAWLDAQPNKSQALRDAARLAMDAGERLDLNAFRRVLREELAKVVVGQAPAAEGEVEDADPQAAALLDQMF
jgi:hypothetical protein